MDLTNEVYDSVIRYFNTLSHTGYKSYSEVYELILFTFIEEMLYGPLSQFITDKDYNDINKAINCLYGSCMIPYPSYKKSFDPISNRMLGAYRYTEDDKYRVTQLDSLRILS